jgi:hypothetical protein
MKHAIALLLCLLGLGARAQPVYRCGNAYSSIACPAGKVVEAADTRTAEQRAEAKRVAIDDQRLAAEMRRERLVDQAMLKPAAATSLSGTPAASPHLAHAVARHPLIKKRALTKPAAGTPFTAAVETSR